MHISVVDYSRGSKLQAGVDILSVLWDTHEPRAGTPPLQCGMDGCWCAVRKLERQRYPARKYEVIVLSMGTTLLKPNLN